MHVSVNGVRLFFDVEGAKLVPDGPMMREKPTLLMLHGGPGADHSIYRPAYSALADIAQIVYLDHRGNGRSEDGPRESWNLAQWGDDVRAFCDALGIVDPIVLGASFGGMVALSYATRHPAHPSKLVLISTEAAGGSYRGAARRAVRTLRRPGSRRAGAAAVPGSSRAIRTRPRCDAWRRLAMPHYTRIPRDPDTARRADQPAGGAALVHQARRREPQRSTCFRDLDRIQCPTLVLGGEDDPIHPIESQADIAAALPPHLVQFERFADCRHAVRAGRARTRHGCRSRDFIHARQNKTGARGRRF